MNCSYIENCTHIGEICETCVYQALSIPQIVISLVVIILLALILRFLLGGFGVKNG